MEIPRKYLVMEFLSFFFISILSKSIEILKKYQRNVFLNFLINFIRVNFAHKLNR